MQPFKPEGVEMDPSRAGAQNQCVDAALDLFFQKGNAFGAAQNGMGFGCKTFIFGTAV
jgi:hypothetical protein